MKELLKIFKKEDKTIQDNIEVFRNVEEVTTNSKDTINISLRIKLLNEMAKMPKYSQDGDVGLDLTATSLNFTSGYIQLGTGISLEIPKGYFGLLLPRSSITKSPPGMSLKNSCGVIDSNYRGEIIFRFELPYNFKYGVSDEFEMPKVGERVGQIIILPHPTITLVESQELSDSNRGSGGFGSTGK
jgi:dUTP pyrophosphatase